LEQNRDEQAKQQLKEDLLQENNHFALLR